MYRFCLAILGIVLMTAATVASDRTGRAMPLNEVYTLGSGDRVRVTVYGETDLSGTFEISGSGAIAYPLVGEVSAGGKTVRELERAIAVTLEDGYLRQARVSAEVTNYRPFYIIGEVRQPGSYPYVEGMKIVNAVALGGGYTYRARENRFLLRRVGDPKEKEVEAKPDDFVYPGDVVRVPERFF
ncbi:MAG: polysaccharide biosynthesis/export family protein [Rhodospirillaceae bacterium]